MPTEDIIRRFYRSKSNFWHIYKNTADQWELIYNSEARSQEVAFGERNQFTVTNTDLFHIFIQDVNTGEV